MRRATPAVEARADSSCTRPASSSISALDIPNIMRFVRESGRPTPRHVATSMTVPCPIFPMTSFWPSGKSITKAESDIGRGTRETIGLSGRLLFLLAITIAPFFHEHSR